MGVRFAFGGLCRSGSRVGRCGLLRAVENFAALKVCVLHSAIVARRCIVSTAIYHVQVQFIVPRDSGPRRRTSAPASPLINWVILCPNMSQKPLRSRPNAVSTIVR